MWTTEQSEGERHSKGWERAKRLQSEHVAAGGHDVRAYSYLVWPAGMQLHTSPSMASDIDKSPGLPACSMLCATTRPSSRGPGAKRNSEGLDARREAQSPYRQNPPTLYVVVRLQPNIIQLWRQYNAPVRSMSLAASTQSPRCGSIFSWCLH